MGDTKPSQEQGKMLRGNGNEGRDLTNGWGEANGSRAAESGKNGEEQGEQIMGGNE